MEERIRSLVEAACSRIGYSRNASHKRIDTVLGALGSHFFDCPRSKKSPISQDSILSHPLLRTLTDQKSPPELAVSGILELGIYLDLFAQDPAMPEILGSLRTENEYESRMFQLAMAYRLHRLGTEPVLEPSTDRGRADIKFNFRGNGFIVECYRPRLNLFERLGEFECSLANMLIDVAPEGKAYRFKMEIDHPLTNDGMRRVYQEFRLLANHLQYSPGVSIDPSKQRRDWRVEFEDITGLADPDFDEPGRPSRPLRTNEADLVVSRAWVQSGTIFELRGVKSARLEHRSRVLIRRNYLRQPSKTAFTVLEKKIGSKLKQTKVSAGELGRLLFVEFQTGLHDEGSHAARQKIQKTFTRRFPAVAGVLLVERSRAERHFGYSKAFLPGNRALELGLNELFRNFEPVNLLE